MTYLIKSKDSSVRMPNKNTTSCVRVSSINYSLRFEDEMPDTLLNWFLMTNLHKIV